MKSANQVDFGGSDEAALAYIRKRTYASYSSMVNVRDKKEPQAFVETDYYRFGKELHSRFLERKKTCQLTPEEEVMLKEMVCSLANDVMVQKIMDGATCEIDFDEKVNGLRCYGRIDIKNFAIGDLKTTRHTSRSPFIASMDFLQAALYTRVSRVKDFYYIGISKVAPYNVMVFNVNQFPERIEAAHKELNRLTVYIKSKL
jgi:hypothetical protein